MTIKKLFERLREQGLRDEEIAVKIGSSVRSVQYWSKGKAPKSKRIRKALTTLAGEFPSDVEWEVWR